MSLQNIKQMREERGFTLVELLIVIVIIAILAAIVIVAYNGITVRAHTSAAQQAAQNVANKTEAYNAENGGYPSTFAALTGAAQNTSYYLPTTAVTFKAGTGSSTATPIVAAPASDSTIALAPCKDTVVYVGAIVSYWNFSTGAAAYINQGQVSGSTSNGAVTCNYSAT